MNIPRWLFRLALGRRLPTISGEIEVTGARSAVTIRRDRYGIPYIEAESDEDAWYGVGFCQGQDRAFQLEMLLRIARGTVSELAGPAGLGMDGWPGVSASPREPSARLRSSTLTSGRTSRPSHAA